MSTIFEVLAEPKRRQILELLRTREHSVGELVEALDLSQPAVSKHLRVLKQAGLVEVQVDAQRRLYTLRAEPLKEVDAWLTAYRRLWEDHFDRLDDYLRTLQSGAAQPPPAA